MPIQTIGTDGDQLANATRALYLTDYMNSIRARRMLDQVAKPVSANMAGLQDGTTVTWTWLASLPAIRDTISEIHDVVPQTTTDATGSITKSSRAGAIQWSEALDLHTYLPYGAERFKIVGDQCMDSLELMAMDALYAGSVRRGAAVRASLDAGGTGHQLSLSAFIDAGIDMTAKRAPGWENEGGTYWAAYIPPEAYRDLKLSDTTFNNIIKYQNWQLLNGEVGVLDKFRVIVDPRLKRFYAAGAANTTAINTTVATAVEPFDTVVKVASGTNIAAGMKLLLGTVETASTFYPTNELVEVVSVSTNDVTIVGSGENGGCQFAHAVGESVKNNDTVYPCIFCSAEALAKVYDVSTGEYGMTVGPKVDGMVDQFKHLGWKYYGNYGRWTESRILRYEVSSAKDA